MLSKSPCIPKSIFELGCNIGINLHALIALFPQAELEAVEINSSAVAQINQSLEKARIYEDSILNFKPIRQYELTFTSGVLIHIAPENLPIVYDTLFTSSSRLILINEYFSPTPVEITYRGHESKLFKRDFCGELLDRFSSLRLIDYGFSYSRDPLFPTDNATWFLLEKTIRQDTLS